MWDKPVVDDKKIKVMESEIDDLKREVVTLKREKSTLQREKEELSTSASRTNVNMVVRHKGDFFIIQTLKFQSISTYLLCRKLARDLFMDRTLDICTHNQEEIKSNLCS